MENSHNYYTGDLPPRQKKINPHTKGFGAGIKKAVSSFSKKEYIVFFGLIIILCVSTLAMLENINKSFMVSVATKGGRVREGIVGVPRFINPVLANSPADQDLVSLVYSGLMRKDPNGDIIPDLAFKYEILENGLIYIFTLKDRIYFHDETPVTVDDIIFTINKINDPIIKNPKKGNWDGVIIEKIDEKTIKFKLKQPYASFLENTTLGIMPEHLWNNSPIELNDLNIKPIGSGPYKIERAGKQALGLIDYYDLTAFRKFSLSEPYIKKITLRFYPNEEAQIKALENGEVDQISSITPSNAEILKEKNYQLEKATLPRVFGLFFNQNQNQIFIDKNIIRAIDLAIDKDNIVGSVLSGYGTVIESPIPPGLINYQKSNKEDNLTREEKIKKAQDILDKDGWKRGADGFLEKTATEKKKKKTVNLEFSISTSNAPELAKSALLIKQDLESIGMRVAIKTFEIGNLNQGVIRPRKYDALLFGEIINHESDLFAFWHSSQRKDPGLNVAMYTNAKVDKILEDAFITVDESARIKKYMDFENEIKKEMPTVFLYSPDFIYVVSKDIRGFDMDQISTPADRFSNLHLWYTKTENIWKIFSK